MEQKQQSKQAKKQAKATQDSLLIAEIRDGVVVLKDGSMRAVVLASAINFDLMSPQEREGVEYGYQSFLNSLHFQIQVVIRSQKMDLDNYIARLLDLRQNQDNELLGLLMEDYIANIKALIEEVNIMDKQFYVVVPYYPPVLSTTNSKNPLGNIVKAFKHQAVNTVSEADFVSYKEELAQRVNQVTGGLGQMGVRNIPLNTQELIDLYYNSYNPDVAQNQKLIEFAQLQTPAVTKGEGQAPTRLAGGPLE